jgi:crotonobetainyl-CoA:carnitine CoA-transferase CaiB-like acyl-CoA transferase
MLPLARFKVLDLTRARAGPTAVRHLADWGAQVIKIEAPADDMDVAGPRDGPDFQNLHRNKRSMTLNLKTEAGLEIMRQLAARADVVVENFRPDVKYRLGIDYDSLKALNPRLVYGSISGFGQNGPYADRPGVDQIAQGLGGLMSITGLPGQGPVRVGIAVADVCAGLYLALGILNALIARDETGEGQWVHTSLLQAQIAILDFQAARWLIDHRVPRQAGNDHPTAIPTGVFKSADGLVNLAASGQNIFRRFCRAVGAEHLLADPRFATGTERSRHRAALNVLIAPILAARTTAHWVEVLNAAGVPCGPINAIDQTFADPQVQHLGIAQEVTHPRLGPLTLVGEPISMPRNPATLRSAAPELGEHTDEILRDLGYAAEAIADLRRQRVI